MVSCSVTLDFIFLRQLFSLNMKLVWQTTGPGISFTGTCMAMSHYFTCSMVLNSGPQDYPTSSLVSCKRAHMFVSFFCLIFMNIKSCPYCYKWQIFIFSKNWIGFYCECLLVLCHFKWEWFSQFCPYNYACVLWFKRPLYGQLLFYLVSNFNI